jgi:hypothetical protein
MVNEMPMDDLYNHLVIIYLTNANDCLEFHWQKMIITLSGRRVIDADIRDHQTPKLFSRRNKKNGAGPFKERSLVDDGGDRCGLCE